jgi:integrase
MGVYKRPGTKKWTASVGSGSERQRKDFLKKKDADEWHAEMQSRLNKGMISKSVSKTMKSFFSEFEENVSKRVSLREGIRKSHAYSLKSHWNNYILAENMPENLPKGSRRTPFDRGLGGVKLSELTTARIERFKDDLRDAGMSAPNTRAVMRSLHSGLELARRRDYIHINPSDRVIVYVGADEKKKVVPPTPRLLSLMISECREDDVRETIMFLSITALRVSEAFALRWGCVDFDKRVVRVERMFDDSHKEEDMPKSNAGRRSVPIGQKLLDLLVERRKRSAFASDDDLVFGNQKGRHRSQKNDRARRLQPLYERCAMMLSLEDRLPDGKFGFHTLRHYGISAWINAGFNPKAVQTFAGHASIAITMDRYGHLFPSDDHRSAMDMIAAAVGS